MALAIIARFYIVTLFVFLWWKNLFLSGLKGYFYYLCARKTNLIAFYPWESINLLMMP